MQHERKPLNPLYGIAVFILTLLVMFFAAFPLQTWFGMTGLALTELLILIIAVIPALVFRQNLRDVFPFHKPRLREIFGTLLIWFGGLMSAVIISSFTSYLFPQEMNELTGVMTGFFASVPAVFTFLIVAIMPAICEEALHRGFILYTFRGVRSKWAVVVSMGLVFGIFHLDPLRFLPTAFLGALLTYVMIETKNLFLPMLFHLVNNSLSSLASLLIDPSEVAASAAAAPSRDFYLVSIASSLVMGCCIPFALYLGSRLIRAKKASPAQIEPTAVTDDGWELPPETPQPVITKPAKSSAVPIAVCVILTILLFCSGVILAVTQYFAGNPAFDTAGNTTTEEVPESVLVAMLQWAN